MTTTTSATRSVVCLARAILVSGRADYRWAINERGEDVKPILVKLGVGAASLVLAVAVWYVVILALRYSGVNALQQITFWVSPLSFTGWLVLLALWVVLYLALRKFGPGFLAG